jgi:hypothetical protein
MNLSNSKIRELIGKVDYLMARQHVLEGMFQSLCEHLKLKLTPAEEPKPDNVVPFTAPDEAVPVEDKPNVH